MGGEGVDDEGRMKFWIKQHPNGEVGRWIHSRKVGENIEIRGPMRTWNWKGEDWDEVIMVRIALILVRPAISSSD